MSVVPDATSIPVSEVILAVQIIDTRLYALTAEIFLYGAYAVMFGFYLNVMRTRGISKNRFIAISTIALFILCTIHCIFLFVGTIFSNAHSVDELISASDQTPFFRYNTFYRAANAVYVTSKVVIIPTISTVAVAVLTNFLLMGLSGEVPVSTLLRMINILLAGRIWWLARKARRVMGQKETSEYYTVCAMILESGALYCAGGILFIVMVFYPFTHRGLDTFDVVSDLAIHQRLTDTPTGAILGQLVGIAPTIIAVRVGLGKSVESGESFSLAARPPARHSLEFHPSVSAANFIEHGVLYLGPESGQDCGNKSAV
ncbi:hypothetical protein B0H13DRAFT_1876241 [Mycena leptocephala]|nr:hypothetical protein B0H13DRAFT_1876241 [Mycena leptocephala]